MISHKNLPSLLGDQFVKGADYAMTEIGSSGRAGTLPSPKRGPGYWKSLGQFHDPEHSMNRQFNIYQWVPVPPGPKPAPSEAPQ